MVQYPKSLLSGLIGAVVVTTLNEGIRRVTRNAPQLQELGMDAATQTLKSVSAPVPGKKKLFWATMIADLISNALYYSVINLAGKKSSTKWALGTGLGLAAGLGAVLLPEPLHLDASTTNKTTKTKALTVGWYLAGALVTTALVSLLSDKKNGK